MGTQSVGGILCMGHPPNHSEAIMSFPLSLGKEEMRKKGFVDNAIEMRHFAQMNY